MAERSFDVVVIGAGPGGYAAANRASQLGMKAAVIEKERPGGICLNWGCIPSKSLLKNAEVYQLIKHKAKEFGITVGDVSFDFAKVMKRSRDVADRLSTGVKYLLEKYKVETIAGAAAFADSRTLAVKSADGKTETVRGKHVIIATGARPREIPGVAFDNKRILNYFGALSLTELPKTAVVIGAGAIGVEFAYFWSSFGTKVTIVEMLPQILPLEDEEVSAELAKEFKKNGIAIKTGTRVNRIQTDAKGATIEVEEGGKKETLEAEVVLVAIGVQANTEALQLDRAGVKTEKGFVVVDKSTYKTSAPGIYAIGDCIGAPMLAHVATAEGITCVEKIAGHSVYGVDYDVIPGCTYCQPQVASVGLTEKAAREKGHEVKVGKFPFRASGKAVAVGETKGFAKLVFDAKKGTLLGAHLLGNEATELIAEMTLARNYELTHTEIVKTIHAHPTLSECTMEAAAVAWDECVNL